MQHGYPPWPSAVPGWPTWLGVGVILRVGGMTLGGALDRLVPEFLDGRVDQLVVAR